MTKRSGIPSYLDSITAGLIPCVVLELANNDRQVKIKFTSRNFRELGFSQIEFFSVRQIVPRDKIKGRTIAPYDWKEILKESGE